MLRSETIELIAIEEIGKLNPALQLKGSELLEQWKSYPPGNDFCEKIIIPAIQHHGKSARKRAIATLKKIKERIGTVAADHVREQELHRRSAEAMKQETLHVYDVIERQGRGVVYFGSARTKPGDPDYEAGRELGREIAMLLGVTSWTGGGPGAMESPIAGAKEVGGRVGAVKIRLHNEEFSFEKEVSSVFDPREVALCNYFGPRKVGLVDAAMANDEDERRAVVAFPGGFGTLDEMMEILTLMQTGKLGTKGDLPVILMNYGGYYDELLAFFHGRMLAEGKVKPNELKLMKICADNKEALDYLAGRFKIPPEERTYDERLQPPELWHKPKTGKPDEDQSTIKMQGFSA